MPDTSAPRKVNLAERLSAFDEIYLRMRRGEAA